MKDSSKKEGAKGWKMITRKYNLLYSLVHESSDIYITPGP